eukprot:TRINITY_DN2712_c0_g3_i1.p1 TRINITY_DN2712_c0_g3~~TRINITY_DN2712_c0_g3_i1.p1  ORF type:complete len:615 (+),score=176.22 TRINITY_DN2712_c0_g3_i1:83-1927(+)
MRSSAPHRSASASGVRRSDPHAALQRPPLPGATLRKPSRELLGGVRRGSADSRPVGVRSASAGPPLRNPSPTPTGVHRYGLGGGPVLRQASATPGPAPRRASPTPPVGLRKAIIANGHTLGARASPRRSGRESGHTTERGDSQPIRSPRRTDGLSGRSGESGGEAARLQRELESLRQQLERARRQEASARQDVDRERARRRQLEETLRATEARHRDTPTDAMSQHISEHVSLAWEDITVDRDKVLGEGGFGTVYLGDYQATEVAVKERRSDVRLSREEDAEWRGEVRIMARLRHPNVLMLLGAVLEADRLAAIVTEYCESGTLQEVLREKMAAAEQVTWVRKLGWAAQIAKGMAFLHHRSVFHRDLKSANIFVSGDTMKIADFGLSRTRRSLLEGLSSETFNKPVRQPRAKGRMPAAPVRRQKKNEGIQGTFAFIAPEIWAERPFSERADVYSFGVLLLEMIALDIPFERDDTEDCSWRIMKGFARPRVLEMVAGCPIPECVRQAMQHCMRYRLEDRPLFPRVVHMLHESIHLVGDEIASWPSPEHDSWIATSLDDWDTAVPDPLVEEVPEGPGVQQLVGRNSRQRRVSPSPQMPRRGDVGTSPSPPPRTGNAR